MIDAHIHYGDDDPLLLQLLVDFDLKLLNICVAEDAHGGWRDQAVRYQTLATRHPQHFAWCTSIDLPRFDDPLYHDAVIAGLEVDFAAGAVACKIWKNIGMEVRKPDGSFLLVDDPYFDPIFEHLAAKQYPLLTHIAEPLECWQPLKPGSPHYGYYSRNPEWHMYGKSEFPSHEALMAARDQVLVNHPRLRMVGAHLASLEYDVDVLAARLDGHPNLAVDISARLSDLAIQDSAKVRDFCLRYQDRILFGTDVVMRQAPSTMPEAERATAITALRQTYEMHLAYFQGSGPTRVRSYDTQGLALPQSVLDKIYTENTRHWYPRL